MAEKILIVESELASSETLQKMLEEEGYGTLRVSGQGSGLEDALARERFDLILIDVSAGGDWDGIAAYAETRERYQVPVVYCIDSYAPDIISRTRKTDPAGYILKPPGQDEIRAVVGIALSRSELEKQLRESEKKYLDLMNSARDVIIILNDDTSIQFVNKYAEEIFGYSADEVQGTSFLSYIHPDEIERVTARFRMRVAGREVTNQYESAMLHKDGFRVDVEVTGVMVTYMNRPAVLVILRDIRERKRAESALRRSEEEYRILINSLDEAIHVIDENFTITLMNNRFLEWNRSLGLATDIIGKPLFEVFDFLDESILDEYRQVRDTGRKLVTRETNTLNGEVIYTETHKIPIILNDRVSQIVTVISNVTDYVKKEKKITDSLREKEILLKEIHHRVKNNMQVVSSLLNLQSRHITSEEDLGLFRESQNRVYSIALVHEKLYQSENLAEIDFLDYLKSLVRELSHIYLKEKMVDTKIVVDGVFLTIDKAIPCALIVNELVSNAMKHAFSRDEKGTITILIRRDSDNYGLEVCDTGSILDSKIEIENAGTLGLQLVNALIRQLNGTLTLERREGTCFRITFPVNPDLHGG